MMSELYLCVQGFFFYEHGCVDPHPSPTPPHVHLHLHLHLLLRIYKQDIATKHLHSRSIDATTSSPALLCTMSESQTDICERWLTHPCEHSHQSVGKKKGICSICLKSETDMLMTHVYTNTVSYWHSCQKSPKRGLHCIVWFLVAINWASKQDSIFSILKTQPRLNNLENRVTENKASWQGVDSISFKINKQKLCHILLCIKAANDSLHFITGLTNYWNYYDATRGPACRFFSLRCITDARWIMSITHRTRTSERVWTNYRRWHNNSERSLEPGN